MGQKTVDPLLSRLVTLEFTFQVQLFPVAGSAEYLATQSAVRRSEEESELDEELEVAQERFERACRLSTVLLANPEVLTPVLQEYAAVELVVSSDHEIYSALDLAGDMLESAVASVLDQLSPKDADVFRSVIENGNLYENTRDLWRQEARLVSAKKR